MRPEWKSRRSVSHDGTCDLDLFRRVAGARLGAYLDIFRWGSSSV